MAFAGIDQDCGRGAANITRIKTLRDHNAKVFETILRRIVVLAWANENVVTFAAVARTKGREPVAPIITALALVEATRGEHGKLVGAFTGMRAIWKFKAPSVAAAQTVEDALAAVFY